MKHAKRIGALICVLVICFTLTAAPSAHAAGSLIPQSFGAWISAALVSINIVGQSLLPAPGPVDPYFQWLSSPQSETQVYDYPVGRSVIQDYLNAATIKVDQGVTTIDGVAYDELFIEPGTFTDGLKTNIFDFKTKWNILSGQSDITLAKGVGYFDGIPLYGLDLYSGNSAFYEVQPGGQQLGTNTYYQAGAASNYNWADLYLPYGRYNSGAISQFYSFPYYYRFSWSGIYLYNSDRTTNIVRNIYANPNYFVNSPFEYTYTSGIVPATQSDIPENYGLSIQIPHDQLQTFYNTYPQYNVDNSIINIQQDQIDIDELTQAIFDQIQSMDDLRVEWNEGPVEPEPEPEPPEPVEDVIEGLNVITQQQFEQMQQQTNIQRQQQQMQQQQFQEQQQISQNTSEINDTIKDVTAMPDAEQLPSFKFDLRELFPFCIPFDIYRLLSSFDAEPQAPHVQLPIVIDSINFRYNLDLDFSAWDPVAQAMRTAELIVYAIGLAWATGKVIKW